MYHPALCITHKFDAAYSMGPSICIFVQITRCHCGYVMKYSKDLLTVGGIDYRGVKANNSLTSF